MGRFSGARRALAPTARQRTMTPTPDIPFMRFLGAELVEWSEGRARFALAIRPEHLNRTGVVHGGVYSVLVDAAGGLAGCYSADPAVPVRSFTLSLATSFLEAANGGTLHAIGTARRQGRQVYFSTVDVKDDAGRLVAMGEGSFLYQSRGERKGS